MLIARDISILLSGLPIGYRGSISVRCDKLAQVLLPWLWLIVAATALVSLVFLEPKMAGLETPWSGQGIYLIAYGTLLHLFSGVGRKNPGG